MSRATQAWVVRLDGLEARAGVEPNIEDVLLALEVASTTRGTGQIRGKELRQIAFVPRISPVLCEDGGRAFDHVSAQQRLLTRRAAEGRYRHTPRPLPRDAPVRARREHPTNPLFSPVGETTAPW